MCALSAMVTTTGWPAGMGRKSKRGAEEGTEAHSVGTEIREGLLSYLMQHRASQRTKNVVRFFVITSKG